MPKRKRQSPVVGCWRCGNRPKKGKVGDLCRGRRGQCAKKGGYLALNAIRLPAETEKAYGLYTPELPPERTNDGRIWVDGVGLCAKITISSRTTRLPPIFYVWRDGVPVREVIAVRRKHCQIVENGGRIGLKVEGIGTLCPRILKPKGV